MFKSLFTYIDSPKTARYTLLVYLIAIFVVSGLNIRTSSHGFIYKDKFMHLGQYYILGILFIRYFIVSKNLSFRKSIIFTLIFGSLYAISDEIHQGFVGYFSTGIFGGVRDPDIFDVFADITGLLVSIATYSIISIKYTKLKLNGKFNEGF